MTKSHCDPLFDRARGALLGLAVGDALGTTLEFTLKEDGSPLIDMVGGGPFRLEPGEWTDDTSMALALAESLLAKGGLDEHDLMRRFCAWWEDGEYSHNGRCFDIGITVRTALSRFRATGDPIAGSTDPYSAGNGSLMRLSPVAIRYCYDADALSDAGRRQSRTTHGAEEAVATCEAYAGLLAEAIRTGDRDAVLQPRTGNWPDRVARAMGMETVDWDRADVWGSGYVIHSLEASLWAVGNARDYREAVLLAANLGEGPVRARIINDPNAGADLDPRAAIIGRELPRDAADQVPKALALVRPGIMSNGWHGTLDTIVMPIVMLQPSCPAFAMQRPSAISFKTNTLDC